MKTSTQPSPAPGRYIDLMFDRGFKRVFGKPANKDILIAFLNEVISNNVIPGPDPGESTQGPRNKRLRVKARNDERIHPYKQMIVTLNLFQGLIHTD